eukprot:COSAG05_NODE_738_length_7631_cov_2086.673128_1_plen_64_part_00
MKYRLLVLHMVNVGVCMRCVVWAVLYLGLEVVMRLLSSLRQIVPVSYLLPTYCVAAAVRTPLY